eukprot:2962839-Amphidinium_carterae.1
MTKRKKSSAKRRARRARAKNQVEKTVGAFGRRLRLQLAGGDGRGVGGPARVYENIALPQNRRDREDDKFSEPEADDFVRPTSKPMPRRPADLDEVVLIRIIGEGGGTLAEE